MNYLLAIFIQATAAQDGFLNLPEKVYQVGGVLSVLLLGAVMVQWKKIWELVKHQNELYDLTIKDSKENIKFMNNLDNSFRNLASEISRLGDSQSIVINEMESKILKEISDVKEKFSLQLNTAIQRSNVGEKARDQA